MPVLHQFFISYCRESSEDSQFALKLAKDLRPAGVDVWIDQLDLQPGKTAEEILNASAALLVILSPESVNSAQMASELSVATTHGRWIEAILFRTCELHEFRQPLDFRTDYRVGLN